MYEIDMGPWPCEVHVCFDEKDYKRRLRKIKNLKDTFPNENAWASTVTIESEHGYPIYVLSFGRDCQKSSIQMASSASHEASHVAYNLWEHINEHNPGDEAQAYLIGHIVRECLRSFKQYKKKIKKSR